MNDDTALAAQKQLMRLMTQHRRRIFSYIYTLVPYRADAEDLLQETSLVICEKFGQFQIGMTSRRGPAKSRIGKCGGRGRNLRGRKWCSIRRSWMRWHRRRRG